MPQDITNDLKGHRGVQQADRSCMAKSVRALPSSRSDSSHLQSSADDTIKDRSVFIGPIRRPDLQKQLSMLALWSSILEIAQHRFTGFQSIDDTGNAVLDQGRVEVDEQPQTLIGQP